MSVYTYANYTLVEETEEYEYKHKYFWYAGIPVPLSDKLYRRSVHTMTWEATLTEKVEGEPAAYDFDQGYPGSVNPGNLDVNAGWRLQSVEYTRGLSQPLSKHVRETWYCNGQWEEVDDYSPTPNN